MGEAAFQLINAILFAIVIAITPPKQMGAGGVAQSGIQEVQPVAASSPVAAETNSDGESRKEDTYSDAGSR